MIHTHSTEHLGNIYKKLVSVENRNEFLFDLRNKLYGKPVDFITMIKHGKL